LKEIWQPADREIVFMKKTAKTFLILAAVLMFVLPCRPKEFSAMVVDGLGRPIEGVKFSINWLKEKSDGDVEQIDLLNAVSQTDGFVRGHYNEKTVPSGKTIWSQVEKDGYSGYSMDGIKSKYELQKEFSAADFDQIAKLSGEAQKNELREILAGRVLEANGKGIGEFVFFHDEELRPALRSLVADSNVGTQVMEQLAFIGDPDDLDLIVQNAPKPKKGLFDNRWAYEVVTSLFEPSTDKEWSFLEKCAAGDYHDFWVDAGAIKTLKLIASPKSSELLQKVLKRNPDRARSIQASLDYIKSSPAALADADLNEAGKKVAQAIKIGDWQGNKNIRYNKNGNKALVDCEFIAGRDLLIHTATFHKVAGVWKLRGVRETMQALLANPPPKKTESK
jgi:hypothetical protein